MSKTERPVVGIGEILFDLLPGGAQLGARLQISHIT